KIVSKYACSSCSTHGVSKSRVIHQESDGIGYVVNCLFSVLWSDTNAAIVGYGLGRTAGIQADNWQASSHGFQDRDSTGVVKTGEHKAVEFMKHFQHCVSVSRAQELHTVCEVVCGRNCFQPRPVRSFADDRERYARLGGREVRQGLNSEV